jgi:hypothetical protein
VTVNTPPTATITPAGPTTFCQGGSVVLNAPTGTGYTYQWYNGTTAISSAITASFTATTAGSYTVTVSGGVSCNATSSATVVTVNALPTATIIAGAPTANDTVFICPGGSVTLSSGPSANLSYQWKLNGTNVPAGGTSSTYSATQPGVYTLTATSITTSCSATSASIKVVRDSISTVVSHSGPATFCAGGNLTLSVLPTPATSFQWLNGGAQITGANTPTFGATATGVYSVQLIHVNPSGSCTFTSAASTVTVKSLPTPVVTYTGGMLSVAGTYTSYQWKQDTATIAGATAATFTPTSNGSYSVMVDSNGCTGTSVAVIVDNLGVNTIAGNLVKLFPNPTADRVQVTPAALYNVKLKDLQGRVLMAVEKVRELDLSTLADGVYFASFSTASGMPLGAVRVVKASR